MTAGADLRLLRAAVFTAVCVLLSAAGHSLAAGAPLPLWTLGAGCAVVLAVAAPLAGRERSLPGIAASLAAGQAVLHGLFAAGHTPGAVTPPAGARDVTALARQLLCNDGARALSEPEARRIVAEAGLSTGPASASQTAAHHHTDAVPTALDTAFAQLSLPMLLGHLLAAVTLGWLLRRGEAALWRLVRLSGSSTRAAEELLTVRALRAAVRLLRALWHGLLPGGCGPDAALRPAVDRTPRRPAEPLVGAASRRGPPSAKDAFHLAA